MRRGFTLLELILVLVIVATLLGVSAASLRGLHAQQTARAAAEHFLRVCQQARHRAVHEARPYRVTLDLDAATYRVSRTNGEHEEPLGSELGRRFELDERFAITGEGLPTDAAVAQLDFHPDGRSQPFRVTFHTATERYAVVRPAMTERMRIE